MNNITKLRIAKIRKQYSGTEWKWLVLNHYLYSPMSFNIILFNTEEPPVYVDEKMTVVSNGIKFCEPGHWTPMHIYSADDDGLRSTFHSIHAHMHDESIGDEYKTFILKI